MDRIGTFELLTGPGKLQQLVQAYKTVYRQTRREWKKIIKKNNGVVRQLLDAYADALIPIVFDETGKVKIQGTVHQQKSTAEIVRLTEKLLSPEPS